MASAQVSDEGTPILPLEDILSRIHQFIFGQDLQRAADGCQRALALATHAESPFDSSVLRTLERGIACLRGQTRSLVDFSAQDFHGPAFEECLSQPEVLGALPLYWAVKTQLHYLAGDPQSALAASTRVDSALLDRLPASCRILHHAYTALAAAAALPGSEGSGLDVAGSEVSGYDALRACFDEHSAAVRRLGLCGTSGTHAPPGTSSFSGLPNHLAADRLLPLLDAEQARLQGRTIAAEHLYEKCARTTRQDGLFQLEALANELAARFYRDRGFGRIAEVHLRDALEAYGRWGATGKLRQLLGRHPVLRDLVPVPSAGSPAAAPSLQIDYVSVLKGSRSATGELVVDQLLSALIRAAVEHTGARRGLLLRITGAQSCALLAEASPAGAELTVRMRSSAASQITLPESIARAIVGNGNGSSVIVDDASADGRFADDPEVLGRGLRSLLWLPVASYGGPPTVLYLENNLAPGQFQPAHLDTLRLLTAHAAVSLENARLYADLELREARLRRLVESDVIGILFWELEGTLTDANDAFLRMVGYDRADLLNHTIRWRDMTPPEWRERQRQALEELEATGAVRPWEKEYIRKDGSRIPILVGAASFHGSPLSGVSFVLDLTERKAAEARALASEQRHKELHHELAHANRVATMGQLSDWIAHDVKQPLARIVEHGREALSLLRQEVPQLEAARETLEGIVRAGMGAAEILDRTRELVKKASPHAENVDLHRSVRDSVGLIAPEAARKRIEVQLALGDAPAHAVADRVQLQQVMLNLLLNAIEAMNEVHGEGSNERSSEGEVLEEPPRRRLSIKLAPAHAELMIEVGDTGCGLPPGHADDCFKAFFTTKPGHLGMGLSISRSIVESFGGRIWAESAEPRGALLRFTLPAGRAPE